MAWIDVLKGKVVGLDTAPLIYFIEDNPNYTRIVDPFFEALERREFRVVTSTITLLEVLVNPMKQHDVETATKYRDILLKTRDLSLVALTASIAQEAARLRAVYKLHTADAIEIATALDAKAALFLTNDKRLAIVSDLEIVVLDSLKEKIDSDERKEGS